MKVLKAINNNVVSCLDDNGTELVVMGKGLGFQVKPGDPLNTKMVEKVFHMDSQENVSRLKDLLSRLPDNLLQLCSRICDYANQVLGHRLNESIYLTLTDHIQFAIERSKMNMDLHNALLTEVRVFYPEEFAIGKYALVLIQEELEIVLAEDEAANIALHIVNAEYGSSMNITMQVAQVLHPIMEIVENWPEFTLDRNRLSYDELIVHLKFMAMQAFSPQTGKWVDTLLAAMVQQKLPEAYGCAHAVAHCLKKQSGNTISTAEQAYLAISIQRCRIS